MIDGYSLMHRAFYAIPALSKDGVYTNALFGFFNMLLKVIGDAKPDYLIVTLDAHAPLTQNNINTVTRDMLLKIAHDKEIQITTEVEDIDAGASQLIDHLEVNVSGDTVHGRVCTKIEDTSKITSDQYPSD